MYRRLIVWCGLFGSLYADASWQDALFGKVVKIAENDRLNVRSLPDYHSKKVASLPPGAYVGVDTCRKKEGATWCRVHHLAQYDYEGYGWNAPSGWVNARYLQLSDRGYVLVDGKGNCDYVVSCSRGKCLLVSQYDLDRQSHEITSLHTKKIDRSRLIAQSNFGAASDNMDGYCTIGGRIESYLRE
jgi:uncharacterized protein YraI